MAAAPSSPSTVIPVVGAAILRGERCLATRRSATMSMPLLWEFPGGKVEAGETPQAALRRELSEELGVEVDVLEPLATGESAHGDHTVRLEVYRAEIRDDRQPHPREHVALGWFTAEELVELDWPEADLPAVAAVLRLLAPRAGAE